MFRTKVVPRKYASLDDVFNHLRTFLFIGGEKKVVDKINTLINEGREEIKDINTLDELSKYKVKYLGKKEGLITKLLQGLRNVSPEERPVVGKEINIAKNEIERLIDEQEVKINDLIIAQKIENEVINVELPGTYINKGSIHPLNKIIREIEDYFIGLGYEVVDGPEIEEDKYNFEMMNLPKEHPARAMHDSFYLTETLLLRTHTSPVQARMMEKKSPNPLAMIAPGKTYRRDEDDATHSHQFMQIEGLVIDQGINFSNLKETLLNLVKYLFGENHNIRLRPSFFPFTEPSVEVDVEFRTSDGKVNYIEILGAGMVHPNVLKMGGYNPDVFTGFAFGIGVERLAMIRHGIDDIRTFYNNDIKFLHQFVRRDK